MKMHPHTKAKIITRTRQYFTQVTRSTLVLLLGLGRVIVQRTRTDQDLSEVGLSRAHTSKAKNA